MSDTIPHQWLLKFDPEAQESFDALPKEVRKGIFRQLEQLLKSDDPYSLSFVSMLQDKKFERARKFRVGDYRVLFRVKIGELVDQKYTYSGKLTILDIGHRKEVY